MSLKELYDKVYSNYFRKKFLKSFPDLRFHPSNSIFTYATISLGRNVFINRNAYFSGNIEVGDDVLFGPDVFITSGDHQFTIVGEKICKQGRIKNELVRIDDDVWIGAKVSIMRGVHVHEGAVIGAASIVTKDMPPYCVCIAVNGNCTPVKLRYNDRELREHFKVIKRSEDELIRIIQLRKDMLMKFGREELLNDK